MATRRWVIDKPGYDVPALDYSQADLRRTGVRVDLLQQVQVRGANPKSERIRQMELAPICRILSLFHGPDARLPTAQQAETTWLNYPTNIADSLLCTAFCQASAEGGLRGSIF